MSDNIFEFPKSSPTLNGGVEFIEPSEGLDVIVEGRKIPGLQAFEQEDGRVTIVVDSRFMVDFPPEIARQAAWLLAQALAVGAEYTHIHATSKEQPFAPVATRIP